MEKHTIVMEIGEIMDILSHGLEREMNVQFVSIKRNDMMGGISYDKA